MGLWLGQRSQELAATPAILPRDQVAHSSGLKHRVGPSLCPFTAWNKGDYRTQRNEQLTLSHVLETTLLARLQHNFIAHDNASLIRLGSDTRAPGFSTWLHHQ